jgi:two-component system cell cycle sensor histidine kinase/response regulator CckA
MKGAPDHFSELLDRSGSRAEVCLYYSGISNYKVLAVNHQAARLFDCHEWTAYQPPLDWPDLSQSLQNYLMEALEQATGAPEEKMTPYRQIADQYEETFEVTLYYHVAPGRSEPETAHYFLFTFQSTSAVARDPQSRKLETIGELASGIAHDFNNLIMGMQGNAQLLLATTDLKESDRQRVVNIVRGCTAGASLTRSLLGYAKRQALDMGEFDIIHLVKDVANIIGLALGKPYEIRLIEPLGRTDRTIKAVGCFSSLSHCLMNLIKNARDATPQGGVIEIRWEGNEETACLSVQDFGTGIPAEELQKIFEPFYSTKKKGTGLGLAMVQGIMLQHGGEVQIDSIVGQGTTVSLRWPRGKIDGKKKSRDFRRTTDRIVLGVKPVAGVAHQELAFVVDDDEIVCGAVAGMLQALGFEVKSFSRAEDAISALSPDVAPALIITDYHMPGMDGSEFIRYWHEELPALFREKPIKFILISGHPPSFFAETRQRFPQTPIGVLQKPFQFETLEKKILDPNLNDTEFGLPSPPQPSRFGSFFSKAARLVSTKSEKKK